MLKRKPPEWFVGELKTFCPAFEIFWEPWCSKWALYRKYDPSFDSTATAVKLAKICDFDGIPYYVAKPAFRFLGFIETADGKSAEPNREVLQYLRDYRAGEIQKLVEKERENLSNETEIKKVAREFAEDVGKPMFNKYKGNFRVDMGENL
jgi:hypothetical protein